MAYLIDSSVFISAKNLYYGMDICPAFWDWVIIAHQKGKLFSIKKVEDELSAGQDELAEWASTLPSSFFLIPGQDTIPSMNAVATWAISHQRYSPAAKSTFLQIADFYLVAQALAGNHIIVTLEKPKNSINTIKIPDSCIDLAIEFLSPFEMLRREHARFVLHKDSSQSHM